MVKPIRPTPNATTNVRNLEGVFYLIYIILIYFEKLLGLMLMYVRKIVIKFEEISRRNILTFLLCYSGMHSHIAGTSEVRCIQWQITLH